MVTIITYGGNEEVVIRVNEVDTMTHVLIILVMETGGPLAKIKVTLNVIIFKITGTTQLSARNHEKNKE